MIDILERIAKLQESRGWTEYQLALRAEIPQSTISSWRRKKMLPSLLSLEKICNAFDMTMAQFLAEDSSMAEITPDQRKLLDRWELLSAVQKKAFLELMESVTFR
mgnify:FL=1